MPFPVALSGGQYTTLRASGYWQRTIACLSENTVVFRAQANESITDTPFIQIEYDNVSVGSAADVFAGFVLYISETTNLRDAKFRGRISRTPTSSILYCGENATIVNDGDYLLVTRDMDLDARIRRDTLVDGYQTYLNLSPMIAGLPSVFCLYDDDGDGLVSLTPSQTGVPVASGATINDGTGWVWRISGDGATAYTSGSSTSKHPTIQFDAGYEYMLQCQVTDSNGVVHYQGVRVYAVDRTFSAPANTSLVTGSISTDLEAGYTASITAYADVSALIDRTHCAVFSVEHFGDNSSTPIVTNILMNGRIRSDSIQTQGTEEAGQVQQVTFAVEGITSYLQRLRLPNDIVRASAAPDEWGEMVAPNPFRMAVYAMWVYTTLPNICSFSAESGNFDAWRIGAEPFSIDGGFATDVLNSILWERIHAQPNYAPSGEIFLARNTNYLTNRSGVVTVADFALTDMREFGIDRDSSKVTAQVIAYGGVYNSALNSWTIYTAQSPSIVYGDAPETREVTREILEYDSTAAEAAAELSGRASNDYAFNNPKPLNSVLFYDSMAWLIPTNYQRYTFAIPASANTLGIPYTTADYWQCQSAALTINADGSIDVVAEFPGETEFSDAQSVAALLPNNLENLNPVLPVLPNDPAFPTDPLELYPNDAPGVDDLQPIDNYSLGQTQTPLPPDIASDMSTKQGKPGCQVMAVNFRNSTNTTSPKLTTLGADYLMTLEGFTAYGGNWDETFNDANANLNTDWSGYLSSPVYSGGVWNAVNTSIQLANRRAIWLQTLLPGTAVFTQIHVTYSLTKGSVDDVNAACLRIVKNLTGSILFSQSYADTPDTASAVFSWYGNESVDSILILVSASRGSFGGAATISQIVITGIGLNPFTGIDNGALFADAFYIFSSEDEEGFTAVLYSADEGLRLDNAVVDPANIPPYSANHAYSIAFEGTGNQILARMVFLDYTDKQNKNLSITVCRVT